VLGEPEEIADEMSHSIHDFGAWLSATPLSLLIQQVAWVIPAVQTLHILCIAIVMSSVFMVDLRLLGVIARAQPLAQVAQRFLPPVWPTLVVLLLSGSTLIVGEPSRSLENPAFRVKLLLIIAAIAVTAVLQRLLRRDPSFFDASAARRAGAKLIAAASLLLWIGIVCAGRWIAYLDVNA
jgi:uncharacterized membrane protein SirB2